MTWNAAGHPRAGAGSPSGGQFISANSNQSQDQAAAGAARKLGTLNAKRIRQYQQKNGLKVDGLIGHQTAEALLGHKHAARIRVGALTSGQRSALARL